MRSKDQWMVRLIQLICILAIAFGMFQLTKNVFSVHYTCILTEVNGFPLLIKALEKVREKCGSFHLVTEVTGENK